MLVLLWRGNASNFRIVLLHSTTNLRGKERQVSIDPDKLVLVSFTGGASTHDTWSHCRMPRSKWGVHKHVRFAFADLKSPSFFLGFRTSILGQRNVH